MLADAYSRANRNNQYSEKLKDLYTELESQCENESFRGKLDIWYSFSKYHRYTKKNTDKEIEYLTMVIDHAHEAKEDIYGKMLNIQKSQDRLLFLASDLQEKGQISESLKLKSKVFASRKCYDSAIYYLQKAKETTEDDDVSIELQETQVQYHFRSFLFKKNYEYFKSSKSETKLLMDKIMELPDSSNVKWEILTNKIRQDNHQQLGKFKE